MTLTKRMRYEILRRDNHTCRYCGAAAPDVALTVDHVIPTALGGTDDPSNLVAACKDCNAGKSASSPDAPLVAQVAQDALRWAAAMAKAAEILVSNRDAHRAYVQAVDEEWQRYTYGFNGREFFKRPTDWANSVERFHARGLPLEVAIECVGIALRMSTVPMNRKWVYYMGVCWRRLDELTRIAAELVSAPETTNTPVDGPVPIPPQEA